MQLELLFLNWKPPAYIISGIYFATQVEQSLQEVQPIVYDSQHEQGVPSGVIKHVSQWLQVDFSWVRICDLALL